LIDELELIRRECEAVPGPDPATVVAARSALRTAIDASLVVVVTRPRRRVRPMWLVAVASVAVLVTCLAVLVVPDRRSPIGVQVAAAAYAVLNPTDGRIVHAVSHSVSTIRNSKTGKVAVSTSVDESWSSSGAPSAVHDRHWSRTHRSSAYQWESETTHCGTLSYSSASNMFALGGTTDPRLAAPGAFYRPVNSRYMHYLGKTSFHGIPAFKLAATGYGYGGDFTLIVRRDNYYPLRIVMRRGNWTVVTTYLTYGYVARNPRSEHLLHLATHPGAFFLRYPGNWSGHTACQWFGNVQSLTQRGGKQ
jgi:hypothetical protein